MAQNREERSVGSFEKISVGQAIEVELIKGNSEKVLVDAQGIDSEDVVTEVSGSTLRIRLRGDRHRNVDVKVTVTFKSLRGISVSSAANLYSRSVIDADEFYVDVSSAGSAEIEVNVNSLEIEVSSSGNTEISGKSKEAEIRASSAGSVRAYELEIEDAYIRASSAGSIKITVTKKIDASASSGGSIRYRGNPDKEYTNSSSGGSVRKSG